MKKLTIRHWLSFVLIGLSGQLAWTIENLYFNKFLFDEISSNYNYIATMVAASAVVATVTTLLVGALSDHLGKRKAFIVVGYILWGLVTLSFGFVSVENVHILFPLVNAEAFAAVTIVILDCVMTFFGSSANDAAFNAYITDMTDDSNRGRVESVLAILPLISMLIIFVAFDPLTKEGQWMLFYMIFGLIMIAVAIISIFVLPKDDLIAKKDENYLKDIIYGFFPSVVKENKKLYIALCGFLVYQTAIQVFFPYLLIYLERYLQLENYAISLGVVLIIASIFSVVFGFFIDKIGKFKVLIPSIAIMVMGLILMFFIPVGNTILTIIFGAIMMIGYMVVATSFNALIREYTPKDKIGLFQGIRMIFQVALPMCIGPFIGSAIIQNSETYIDEFNRVVHLPIPEIFIGAAIVLLFSLIPAIILILKNQKHKEVNKND